jgi:tetratricopeptide (TPR) repeat protein
MSNRPRSHQIEDESRTDFERRLPKAWVYRRVTPDYGIDGSVEVFGDDGQRTGRHFNVQLRATDQLSLKTALAVRLELDACKYYKSLDVPVLIARFHAPTGKLYVRWFHGFDPYYARGGKKTTTFRLSDSDEWSGETPARLVQDLETIRRVRSKALPVPVPFRLRFDGDLVQGLSAGEISLELRKVLQAVPGALIIGTNLPQPFGEISVSKKEISVNLAGLKSFHLHFSKALKSEAKTALHYDILLACALTLDMAGYSDLAARLIREFAPLSTLIRNIEVGSYIARCFAIAQRFDDAIALAEKLLTAPRSRAAGSMLMMATLARSWSLSKVERNQLSGFLSRFATSEEGRGDALSAATANYNLANYFRSVSRHRAALRHYRRAAKFDPKYLERSYFCREVASVLFLCRRYRSAAVIYERSIALGESGLALALFADALLFSGEYCKALRQFEAYVTADTAPESEFVLKSWALKGLQQAFGISRQSRQAKVALDLAVPDSEIAESIFAERLDAALRADALCGLAWFNLGSVLNRQGKRDDACIAYLWAALINRNDAQAWANAFLLSVQSQKYFELAPYILVSARFAAGDAFAETLFEISRLQPAGTEKDRLIAILDELISQVPEKEPPFQIRLIDGEGKVTPIPVK